MDANEKSKFSKLLTELFSNIYNKPVHEKMINAYFNMLHDFSFADVRDACTRHVKDPDIGIRAPVPADIIRQLQRMKDEKYNQQRLISPIKKQDEAWSTKNPRKIRETFEKVFKNPRYSAIREIVHDEIINGRCNVDFESEQEVEKYLNDLLTHPGGQHENHMENGKLLQTNGAEGNRRAH